MLKPVLIIGAISLATYYAVKASKTAITADSLIPEIEQVKWTGYKNGALNFSVSVNLINPTSNNLKIDLLFFETFAAGTKISTTEVLDFNKLIEAEKKTKITIPVKVTLLDAARFLLSNLGKLIREGKYPEQIQVKGHITVNDFKIEFDELVNVIAEDD